MAYAWLIARYGLIKLSDSATACETEEKHCMNTIHPATAIGMVTLTVADLARSLAFYEQNIGLTIQAQTASEAWLGVGSNQLLRLQALPGARYAPRTTGLYHFALRVPSGWNWRGRLSI